MLTFKKTFPSSIREIVVIIKCLHFLIWCSRVKLGHTFRDRAGGVTKKSINNVPSSLLLVIMYQIPRSYLSHMSPGTPTNVLSAPTLLMYRLAVPDIFFAFSSKNVKQSMSFRNTALRNINHALVYSNMKFTVNFSGTTAITVLFF